MASFDDNLIRSEIDHPHVGTDFDPQALVERVFGAAATPERSWQVASALFEGGAPAEAYVVLVYGLSLESTGSLTAETIVDLLPVAVLEGLAAVAESRGEHDVAGILEAVAGVSAAS